MAKKNEGLSDKWLKKLPEGFMDAAESMASDELKKELLKAERTISSVERDMEDDTRLAAAKEEVKDLGGAYKDTISSCRAKIKAILYVLDNRGEA